MLVTFLLISEGSRSHALWRTNVPIVKISSVPIDDSEIMLYSNSLGYSSVQPSVLPIACKAQFSLHLTKLTFSSVLSCFNAMRICSGARKK